MHASVNHLVQQVHGVQPIQLSEVFNQP
jgi:hypothetical protein